jgi:hypothetical protein
MTKKQKHIQAFLSGFFDSCSNDTATIFHEVGTAAWHYARRWQ